LNPDRRGGKPATNRLSYGAAITTLNLGPNTVEVTESLSLFRESVLDGYLNALN
jgi:hypothetical protein